MKTREILQQQQPVVYKTLYNALKNEHVSHCYLFSGEKGTLKKEAAFLLAQSLICENKDEVFGCEDCMSCIRIAEDNYADLIYIEGLKTIKIEEIEQLQSQFEKTALEKAGHKIFIIENCENLTTKSANSLLKFIEEPSGSLTGIFTTTQIDRVLPTIISRCQTLNFKPLSKDAFYQQALELGLDELNAHLISNLVTNIGEITKISTNASYISAIELFCEYLNRFFKNKNLAMVYLQNKLSKLNKSDDKKSEGKPKLKETFGYFLDIALIFAQDYIGNYQGEDETYLNLLKLATEKEFNYASYMKALIETKDATNKAANTALLADQLIYKLMEV